MSGRTPEESRGRPQNDGGSVRPDLEIVASKLWSPSARPGTVVRSALLERLQASQAPIVTVIAPGGYGKTTLLGQWVARNSAATTTWLSLDDHDNDPGVMLSYLVCALERVEPVDAQQRRMLLVDAAIDGSSALRRIAAWVSSIRTPFSMVIDHVEAIRNPASGDLIAAVALNLPNGSRLALAARTEPPIPVARLRAEGLIEEIGRVELSMDVQEAGKLLASAGTQLDDTELAELVAHTEGWPVGLYLASHVYTTQGSRIGSLSPPRGDDRIMADYLRAEIIASLPPSTVNLLVRTSILDRLSGPLCDAVMASVGSQELLESLENSNMLIVPLDRERQWYRCHHLVGEMLRAELDRTEPEIVGRLHDRASNWFEANGQLVSAVDHAQLAGDGDRAALLFCRIAAAIHGSGRADTVVRWLRWFEERGLIVQYPQVAALGAFLEALGGQRSFALVLADAAVAGDASVPVPDGSHLDGWIAAMEACLCRHGVAQMRDDAARATQLLSALSPLRGPATVLGGIAAILEGDLPGADTLFTSGAEHCRRNGNSPGTRRRWPSALSSHSNGATVATRWRCRRRRSRSSRTLDSKGTSRPRWSSRLRQGPRRWRVTWSLRAATSPRGPDFAPAVPRRCPGQHNSSPSWPTRTSRWAMQSAREPSCARFVTSPPSRLISARLEEQCAELSRTLDAITIGSSGASSLTAAELRLLPFLSTHLTYKEIGERLFISRNTVKTEATSLFRKLGASSRSEAVQTAEQIGLLGP